MTRRLAVGDLVHVERFRTLPAFDGVIVAKIGCGFNVRDAAGREWFREDYEMTLRKQTAPRALGQWFKQEARA